MSTFSDCPDEMPTPQPLDDAEATFLMAGQVPSGRPDLANVADIVGDLRKLGDGPVPRPSPALAALFEAMPEGEAAPVAPVSSPTRRKRMFRRVGAAASGMTLTAKTAVGAAAALVGLTTAAGAGVLGGSAHDVVSDVVGAVSPFDLDDSDEVVDDTTDEVTDVVDDTTDDGTDTTDDVTDVVDDTTDDVTDDVEDVTDDVTDGGEVDTPDTGHPANHGACVSAVARQHQGGPGHGQAVSEVARSDCGKTPPVDDGGDGDGGDVNDDVDDVTDDGGNGSGGNRGPGSAGGQGNSGHGPSGNQGPGNPGGGNGNPGRGR